MITGLAEDIKRVTDLAENGLNATEELVLLMEAVGRAARREIGAGRVTLAELRRQRSLAGVMVAGAWLLAQEDE